MNAETFLKDTLRPVLLEMGMWSHSAEKLLLMTACHESGGFRTRVQDGGGPARSFFQIEPATHDDLYKNYLIYQPTKRKNIGPFIPTVGKTAEILMDDRYATAIARMIYSRDVAPLPAFEDTEGMAVYWKRVWNTPAGKGTVEKFLADYALYMPLDFELADGTPYLPGLPEVV
jgi:hypothetical protein